MSIQRITLLTDFGTRDGYVAAMKGVIAKACTTAVIDDASHDIDPGDIVSAAFALSRYCFAYPVDAIHVVVVDPTVGSARRAIAARVDGRFLVGPDNGVLDLVLSSAAEVVELPIPVAASKTFHGRDVFAPAAAKLANGLRLQFLGKPVNDYVRLDLPQPTAEGGEVVYIDRFGNLITNIRTMPAGVELAGHSVVIGRTYADVEPGELVALLNSDGLVEIGVRDGNAAQHLAIRRGAGVRVTAPAP